MSLEPKYEHDCPACQFLGRQRWKEADFDLYFCPQDLIGPTLVFRHSNEPPAYGSTPPAIVKHMIQAKLHDDKGHPVVVAYDLAKERGLIYEH